MHNAHWRIDIDLIDGKKNSAMVMRHVEDPASLAAEDVEEPFNRGFEGGVDWDPREFTMLRIETDRKNANGKTIGYDLMPIRMGSARHNEAFTQHDFWVTSGTPRTAAGIHLLQPAQHGEGRGDRRAGPTSCSGPRRPRTMSLATRTASPTRPPGSGPATTPGKARRS